MLFMFLVIRVLNVILDTSLISVVRFLGVKTVVSVMSVVSVSSVK